MRVLIIIAGAALALGGCNKNGQSGDLQNADDNLTASSIVSNDVTAIDAVTGDAANMAADVDMNFGGLANSTGNSTASGNSATAAPHKSVPERLREEVPSTTPATGNAVSNNE